MPQSAAFMFSTINAKKHAPQRAENLEKTQDDRSPFRTDTFLQILHPKANRDDRGRRLFLPVHRLTENHS